MTSTQKALLLIGAASVLAVVWSWGVDAKAPNATPAATGGRSPEESPAEYGTHRLAGTIRKNASGAEPEVNGHAPNPSRGHHDHGAGFKNTRPISSIAEMANDPNINPAGKEVSREDLDRLRDVVSELNKQYSELDSVRMDVLDQWTEKKMEQGAYKVLPPSGPVPPTPGGVHKRTVLREDGRYFLEFYPGEYAPLDQAFEDLELWAVYAKEELRQFFASISG